MVQYLFSLSGMEILMLDKQRRKGIESHKGKGK